MPPRTARARPDRVVLTYRERLLRLREILFANVVMAGEIPSPTGGERRMTRFLGDRFTEAGLANISLDQAGNIAGVLPGRTGERHLLVAAHLDKIWGEGDDHTVSVGVGKMSGRGLADNSLGAAVLATLPLILEKLEIELEANLILLGTAKSFGRGDLGGMRFFLENSGHPVDAAICLEGIDLGRLSYSSLGMSRCEVVVSGQADAEGGEGGAVVAVLSRVLRDLLTLQKKEEPGIRLLVGSIEAGSGHGVAPRSGVLRFEIRSHEAARVARIEEEIARLAAAAAEPGVEVGLEVIARRRPGDLGAGHPLVVEAGRVLAELGVESRIAPSVSELALLLDRGIPSLTLGITRGENRHSPAESIELEPIFDGLAQVVAVLRFLDSGNPS